MTEHAAMEDSFPTVSNN